MAPPPPSSLRAGLPAGSSVSGGGRGRWRGGVESEQRGKRRGCICWSIEGCHCDIAWKFEGRTHLHAAFLHFQIFKKMQMRIVLLTWLSCSRRGLAVQNASMLLL